MWPVGRTSCIGIPFCLPPILCPWCCHCDFGSYFPRDSPVPRRSRAARLYVTEASWLLSLLLVASVSVLGWMPQCCKELQGLWTLAHELL